MTSFDLLPVDVLPVIVSFLRPKSLLRFGLACRQFQDIIQSTEEFWKNILLSVAPLYNLNPLPDQIASTYKQCVVLVYAIRKRRCGLCFKSFHVEDSQRTSILNQNTWFYPCGKCSKNFKQLQYIANARTLADDDTKTITKFKRRTDKIYYDCRDVVKLLEAKKNPDRRNYKIQKKMLEKIQRRTRFKKALKNELVRAHNIPVQDALRIAGRTKYFWTNSLKYVARDHARYYAERVRVQKNLSHKVSMKQLEKITMRRGRYIMIDVDHIEKQTQKQNERKRTKELEKHLDETKRSKLGTKLEPICESLFRDYTVDQLLEMNKREERIKSKCAKFGYQYDRLNHQNQKLVLYVKGSDFNSIDDVLHDLLFEHITATNNERARLHHLSLHQKVELLKLMKKTIDWKEDYNCDFDALLSGLQGMVNACTGVSVTEKESNSLMATVEKSVRTLVYQFFEKLRYDGRAEVEQAIDDYVKLPQSERREEYLEQKLIKLQNKKRKVEQVVEEENVAKRVKLSKRNVNRFSK